MSKETQLFKKFIILILLVILFQLNIIPALAENQGVDLNVPIFNITKVIDIADYIGKIYGITLYIIVPLLIVILMYGGILWISSGFNESQKKKAISHMVSGFIGLGIVLFSYIMLSLVGISTLRMPQITSIAGEDIPEFELLDLGELDMNTGPGGTGDACAGANATYDNESDCKNKESKCAQKGCMKNDTNKYCCMDKPAKAIYVHWSAGGLNTNTTAYTFTVTGDGVVHQNYSDENGAKCTLWRNQKGNMCVSGMGALGFEMACFKSSPTARGENCNSKGVFTEKQIAAMKAKIQELKTKWNIPSLTHSQAAIQDGYHCSLTPKEILNQVLAKRQAAIGGKGGCRWDWYPKDAEFN